MHTPAGSAPAPLASPARCCPELSRSPPTVFAARSPLRRCTRSKPSSRHLPALQLGQRPPLCCMTRCLGNIKGRAGTESRLSHRQSSTQVHMGLNSQAVPHAVLPGCLKREGHLNTTVKSVSFLKQCNAVWMPEAVTPTCSACRTCKRFEVCCFKSCWREAHIIIKFQEK